MRTILKFIATLLMSICLIACQNVDNEELLYNSEETQEPIHLSSASTVSLTDLEGKWVYIYLPHHGNVNRYLSADYGKNNVDTYVYKNDNQIWKFNRHGVTWPTSYILKNKNGKILGITNTSSNPGNPILRPEYQTIASTLIIEPITGSNYYRIYYNFGGINQQQKAYLTSNGNSKLEFSTSSNPNRQTWAIELTY